MSVSDSDSSSSSYGADYKSLKQVSRERKYLSLILVNLIPNSLLSSIRIEFRIASSICKPVELFFLFGSLFRFWFCKGGYIVFAQRFLLLVGSDLGE